MSRLKSHRKRIPGWRRSWTTLSWACLIKKWRSTWSAIDCGVSFTVKITNLHQNYDDRFKPTNVTLHLKAEYFLGKGQPAIEVPKAVFAASPAPTSFFTTIAGVTHNGRQRIIARCSVGERLLLVRDPANRYDAGAIKVMRLNGEQVGFIPAHVSSGGDPSGLASQMDRGDEYGCRIKDLTGGGEGTNLGVNIEVMYGDDEPSPDTPVALPLGQQSRDRGGYQPVWRMPSCPTGKQRNLAVAALGGLYQRNN